MASVRVIDVRFFHHCGRFARSRWTRRGANGRDARTRRSRHARPGRFDARARDQLRHAPCGRGRRGAVRRSGSDRDDYYQPLPGTSSPVMIVGFTNISGKPMTMIEFGLLSNEILAGEARDTGTFTPGAGIKAKLGISLTAILPGPTVASWTRATPPGDPSGYPRGAAVRSDSGVRRSWGR